MATYTTRNRIIKPAQNEFFNSWGTEFNAGASDMLDEAMDGITTLTLTGNVTLTDEDGATDQARKRVLNITSSDGAYTITIPAVEKFYIVRNATAYKIVLTVSGGNSTEVLPGQSCDVFSDGTNVYRTSVSGWGLWSNTAITGSPSTVTCTLDTVNQHFSDCRIIINAVSVPNTVSMLMELRNDAGSGGGAIAMTSASTTGQVYYGGVELPNYRADVGLGRSATTTIPAISSPDHVHAPTGFNPFWKITGGIGDIVFSLSTGNFNNAGSFDVYLK